MKQVCHECFSLTGVLYICSELLLSGGKEKKKQTKERVAGVWGWSVIDENS